MTLMTNITLLSTPGPQVLLVTLPLLVLSEHKSRSYAGIVLFKMLSSASFLIGPLTMLATSGGAGRSTYGLAITIGLLFSLVGDFLLLPSQTEFRRTNTAGGVSTSFQAGVVAFAAAHIAYIIGFLSTAQTISYATLVTTFVATLLLAKWLGVIYPPPHSALQSNILNLALPPDMKPLVLVYAVIISTMFAVATAASDSSAVSASISQRVVGAAMFVVSDVFVAANAFGSANGSSGGGGERGLVRIALGYGLYFWGQMVIAGTVEV
ncbi:YhhN-like protein [Aspergillus pseudoustus]|uniref:YhhN-like protein n=1 Tax=Aspergillus pseudoustus TaxID=1810923 RepID=A0ABR4J6B7_9EURO